MVLERYESLSTTYYCEMCGSPIRGKPIEIIIEGAKLLVCESCFRRVSERQKASSSKATMQIEAPVKKEKAGQTEKKLTRKTTSTQKIDYEVIDNYAEVIKRAREKLGWTTQALANRVMESENVIKRIEQGKLRPTIELARKLEKVLGIKLLQPVTPDEEGIIMEGGRAELTLGDLAKIKEKKRD
jgi:putative transcription factor